MQKEVSKDLHGIPREHASHDDLTVHTNALDERTGEGESLKHFALVNKLFS